MADPLAPMTDFDPRPPPTDTPSTAEVGRALRPAVAGTGRNVGLWTVGAGAGALGLLAFAVLASHRPATVADPSGATASITRPTGTAGTVPPPPTSPDFSTIEAAARGQGVVPVAAVTPPVLPPPAPMPIYAPIAQPAPVLAGAPSTAPSAAVLEAAQRQKAPALVVDLAEPTPQTGAAGLGAIGTAAGPLGAGAPAAGAAGAPGGAGRPTLNGDEQFAARVEGAAEPEQVRASMLRNQSTVIAQGTMIPGVLETALNSDLPGFARAVVSRDVRSFDGSTVLIPRGSHVIGQYKSGVALGASRAFVIWSRVIRPDGASIQIGSSGTDQLGRAGLEGEVNRHFFQRFGGAILLSVINAGITSLTRSPSTSVVIGSSSDATGLASSALSPTNISPTIRVAQGAPIRIFVARDLDFSPVGGVGR